MQRTYHFKNLKVKAGADPGLVGPEAYTILGVLFMKKNIKLGTKVNIYLGPLPESWNGPVQVKVPEACFISFTVNPPLGMVPCNKPLSTCIPFKYFYICVSISFTHLSYALHRTLFNEMSAVH
jgi:hypothetical protein